MGKKRNRGHKSSPFSIVIFTSTLCEIAQILMIVSNKLSESCAGIIARLAMLAILLILILIVVLTVISARKESSKNTEDGLNNGEIIPEWDTVRETREKNIVVAIWLTIIFTMVIGLII